MVEVVAAEAAAAVDAVAALDGVVDARTFGDRLHVRLTREGAAAVDAFAAAVRPMPCSDVPPLHTRSARLRSAWVPGPKPCGTTEPCASR